MFEELDRLLSEEISDDSWYDDGCLAAEDMMLEFSDADWKGLSRAAAHRSLAWQKKLAYCLDCCLAEEALEILDILLCVDDEELSDICMDTLRSFDNECGHRYVQAHPEMMEKPKGGWMLPGARLGKCCACSRKQSAMILRQTVVRISAFHNGFVNF